MTMMLVARALERIGDNAVDIGEQVAFVVTGLFREFSDASRVGTEPAVPALGGPRLYGICIDSAGLVTSAVTGEPLGGDGIAEPPYAERHMTRTLALDGQERRGGSGGQPPIRLAVLDADTGFLQVLSKRLEGAGWQYRVLASPVPLDAIVAMRLNALVIDLAVLGPQGWNYLEKLCARCPGWASSSAPAPRRSPSASAACGWGRTTGSPSRAIRRS